MKYEMPKPEIHGWMSPEELDWLYETALTMNSIVEVGSWRGRSTHCLLTACPGTVYAVDHFKGSPDELHDSHKDAVTQDIQAQFLANVGDFPNLIVMAMSSEDAARVMHDPVDMVFIDATHTIEAVLSDLKAWRPKTRKLLSGHDYTMPNVTDALIKFGIHDYVEHAPKARGIWFVRMERLRQ